MIILCTLHTCTWTGHTSRDVEHKCMIYKISTIILYTIQRQIVYIGKMRLSCYYYFLNFFSYACASDVNVSCGQQLQIDFTWIYLLCGPLVLIILSSSIWLFQTRNILPQTVSAPHRFTADFLLPIGTYMIFNKHVNDICTLNTIQAITWPFNVIKI